MKKIRISELRSLGKVQLDDKLQETRKELMKVNAKIATKIVPENPGSVKQMKKLIAKILTIKNQIKNKKEEKVKDQ